MGIPSLFFSNKQHNRDVSSKPEGPTVIQASVLKATELEFVLTKHIYIHDILQVVTQSKRRNASHANLLFCTGLKLQLSNTLPIQKLG
jgi:hypothetical protein